MGLHIFFWTHAILLITHIQPRNVIRTKLQLSITQDLQVRMYIYCNLDLLCLFLYVLLKWKLGVGWSPGVNVGGSGAEPPRKFCSFWYKFSWEMTIKCSRSNMEILRVRGRSPRETFDHSGTDFHEKMNIKCNRSNMEDFHEKWA